MNKELKPLLHSLYIDLRTLDMCARLIEHPEATLAEKKFAMVTFFLVHDSVISGLRVLTALRMKDSKALPPHLQETLDSIGPRIDKIEKTILEVKREYLRKFG